MKKVSIIIPSLRKDRIKACVKRIIDTQKDIDYEILVVTSLNFNFDSKKVKIIKEKEIKGSNYAIMLGVEKSNGEYIFEIPDEFLLYPDCIKNLIEFIEEEKVDLSSPRFYDFKGVMLENTIYNFWYPKAPFMKKENSIKYGGLYDLSFIGFHGDTDLALRVVNQGGKVKLCDYAWAEYHNAEHDNIRAKRILTSKQDENNFLRKWDSIYGYIVNKSKEFPLINLGSIDIVKDNILSPEKFSRATHFLMKNNLKKVLETLNSNLYGSPQLFIWFMMIVKALNINFNCEIFYDYKEIKTQSNYVGISI